MKRVLPPDRTESTVADRISAGFSTHWFEADFELDVDRVFHNVNTNQEQFIEAFGDHVRPELE
ncbi:hypothetical protein [Natronorubrum sp. DTA28]|uniref:hypothetical protein n=1 Tax=Natronorubrum sp. DTA28 TaxID=3447019 RepID=UPI003F86BB6A